MIDFIAREAHFLDHLAPTWLALPEEVRGQFHVGGALARRARAHGIVTTTDRPEASDALTVVASWGDLRRARLHRPHVVLSEHGAGQSYTGLRHGSYIGADDRDGVTAVLVPGENQAARHRATHPDIPAFAVGCPRLDRWHGSTAPDDGRPVISFHWDCRLVPETRSAYSVYKRALPSFGARFPAAAGHGHPRILAKIAASYVIAGLDVITDFDRVCEQASVYVVDNSSTLFEFAALDRPVVVLNAPHYRRHVDHGMRFWEFADVGIQVDHHAQLVDAIDEALKDPAEHAARRREIVAQVYGSIDGHAARRAADALLELAATKIVTH